MRGSHLNSNTLCIQRLPKDILVCHLLAIFWAKGCESTRVIPIGGEQLNRGAGRSKNLPKGRFLNRTAVHLELLKAHPPRTRVEKTSRDEYYPSLLASMQNNSGPKPAVKSAKLPELSADAIYNAYPQPRAGILPLRRAQPSGRRNYYLGRSRRIAAN
jgi:hypothetical protein